MDSTFITKGLVYLELDTPVAKREWVFGQTLLLGQKYCQNFLKKAVWMFVFILIFILGTGSQVLPSSLNTAEHQDNFQ